MPRWSDPSFGWWNHMTQNAPEAGEQAVQATQRLCRAMIHDLNNPLGALSGYLQLMRRRMDKIQSGDFSSLDSLVEFLDKTQEAMARIVAIMKRLDRYSKAAPLVPRKIQAVQKWREAIDKRQDDERRRVRLEAPGGEFILRTLEEYFEEVAFELLDNALWATEKSGEVEVRIARDESSGAVIEVQDTGGGIDPSMMDVLRFPCFVTRDGKGFPKGGSLQGLGLPTVFQLMQRLKGRIDIESEPGTGTRVSLWFPESVI
jgi:two-component system sensor histidine kinase HydH